MSFFSPLRYPGGKNKLAKFIEKLCVDNGTTGHYIEPYAGGASVALHLLMTGRVREITINDLDKAIYAFWFSVINHTDELCLLIENTPITTDEWEKQKKVLSNKNNHINVLELGFATLFLNRTNYSGVLNAGMIGGRSQTGNYKLDCRFNKKEIIKKIRAIAEYRNNIHVTNLDAISLIDRVRVDDNTIFYFDPPYYIKGPSLYMNHYKHDDHKAVSDAIKSIPNAKWVVSYDDTEEIHELYAGQRYINYSFTHSAGRSRQGNEAVFFSDNIDVDMNLHPVSLTAMSSV